MSVPTGIVTHVQRVKSLYKKALRNLESWYSHRNAYRFHAVLMRERFERNRCIRNVAEVQDLVEKGEEELFQKQHWHVRKFWNSPGGTAYNRYITPPDWVLDYWHPLEKAQYPEYFARREKRKREYIKLWQKQWEEGGRESNGSDDKSC